jgi:putative MATE family efflux protein
MGSEAQTEERRAGLWSVLKEALAGSDRDYTEISIPRAIALLAIPMVLEMSMESLFGLVDVFFVSRLGKDAVAAVGFTESVLTVVFGVAIGLSMSTTALVARRIGEKDPERAAVAAAQAIWLGVFVSVVFAFAGAVGAPQILRIMGAEPGVVEQGAVYTAVILGSSVAIFQLFLLNAVFRGAGDAAVALRVLVYSNGLNIVLDPCLIFGLGPFPELGLLGAAIATTVGRTAGVVYQLWILFRGTGRIRVLPAQMRLNLAVMWQLIRISFNGILQVQIATASWLLLVRLMASFGSAALAGYTIAIRVIVVTILPAWGMSNAAATLVGQNLGAARPDRAERSVWLSALYNMVFLGAVAAFFLLFAEPVIGIFTQDPDVLPHGVDCLRFIAYGFVFYAYGMVIVQAFNGAGDTRTPTIVNFFCYWLWQIPLAWVLSQLLEMGPRGVFLAIAISESTLAVVGVYLFRLGRWKTHKV